MRNSVRAFWPLVFVGTTIEYFYLRQSGTEQFHSRSALVVLAIAVICIFGYFVTNTIYFKKREVKAESGLSETSKRHKITLTSIYSILGLLFIVLNLVTVFNKTDYTGRDTILAGLNIPFLTFSAIALFILGVVLTVWRK